MSGEFPAVAATNQNNINSGALAAAIARAKLVATKLVPNSSSSDPLKRKPEDSSLGEPEKKRAVLPPLAGANNIGNLSNSSAVQEAAQRAAKVADVLARQGMQGIGASGLSTGPVSSKDIKVPDKMVGLIIGRGGEQITRLQAESGCKIQMAADSRGMPERVCTLTGNTQAISKAEDLISQIVQSRSREMMSMGNGASISPIMNSLSNSGSGLSDSMSNAGLPPSISTVSTPAFTQVEIMVPGPKVGLIIGKGGETIKQLQEKSGAKMVVIQDGPSQEAEKPLRISGDPQKVEHAKALVYDFMAEKDQHMQQKGRGRSSGGGSYGQNSNSRSWDSDIVESTIAVPAGKCGVIIGKGGETIKQINQQTGAHCEIDRKQQPNATEKIFVVKGTPDQIEHAKRLFSEKLNMHLGGNNSNGHGNSYGSGMQGSHNMGGTQNFNGSGPWSGHFGPNSQPSQHPWPSTSPGQVQQQQMLASGGGPAAGGNVPINPATGQPDYSAQWVEFYKSIGMIKEAAVIEEQAKANKMTATSMQEMQANFQMSMGLANMKQGQLMSMNQQQPSMASSQQSPQPQPNQNQGAVADYSAQWAQYYRTVGRIEDAEAIESQMKAKAANQSQSGNPSGVAQQQQQPNANSLLNQGAAAQYGLGSFPTAGSAQGYNAPQYAYPNYGAYQQQSGASSGNDALP